MIKVAGFELPHDIDWRQWVERWEKMQDRYLLRRKERFECITRLVTQTQGTHCRVLDLGCGPGSLTEVLLKKCRCSEVFGIDFDHTLLCLAEKRLAGFGERVHLLQADLRDESWVNLVPASVDAVVSAAALHWFSKKQLGRLYCQLAELLRPGGIFINADHVRSESEKIQAAWQYHREQMRSIEGNSAADDWQSFWDAYGRALGSDIQKFRSTLTKPWQGSEEGLPLKWHFRKLRSSGFKFVDCFWRLDCDAIYGGLCQQDSSQ